MRTKEIWGVWKPKILNRTKKLHWQFIINIRTTVDLVYLWIFLKSPATRLFCWNSEAKTWIQAIRWLLRVANKFKRFHQRFDMLVNECEPCGHRQPGAGDGRRHSMPQCVTMFFVCILTVNVLPFKVHIKFQFTIELYFKRCFLSCSWFICWRQIKSAVVLK